MSSSPSATHQGSAHAPLLPIVYHYHMIVAGLLFGGIGALALVSLLTVAVTVHKKMESRQFLDVVVDYSCKDDDTQDVKYLQI